MSQPLDTNLQEPLSDDERKQREYVDALNAVTDGKLVLLDYEQLRSSLGEPLMDPMPITTASQLSDARRNVVNVVRSEFPGFADSQSLINPVGEALNNALKHGKQATYQVFCLGSAVQVVVSDSGPGIRFRTLPTTRTTTRTGWVAALGMGFAIMVRLSDRVLVSTEPGRTVVVLEIDMTRRSATRLVKRFSSR